MPRGACGRPPRRRAGSRNADGRARHVGDVTTTPTDAELLRAARADAGAFRALYDRYATRVLAYHRRRW